MKICVLGLWHLGSVTAACLASLGHEVTGLDFDEGRILSLRQGRAPLSEPGLEALIDRGVRGGSLRFTASITAPVTETDLLWICNDVGSEPGCSPVEEVLALATRVLSAIPRDLTVLVSSQLPIGSVAQLERSAAWRPGVLRRNLACCPENLRLGRAVNDFLHPERIVLGIRTDAQRPLLQDLCAPITSEIVWMSIESAEVSKHALNAFLATSITFTNEVAAICEQVGADARDVERGLRTDARVGARAYLVPGAAFAGGTLARGVAELAQAADAHGLRAPLLHAVPTSNAAHRGWALSRLRQLFPSTGHLTVAIWGLSYKAGTDTLRDSPGVELCEDLLALGAKVRVFDPLVKELPPSWGTRVHRCARPVDAVVGADALVVATPWPGYADVSALQLCDGRSTLTVLDASRSLPELSKMPAKIRYFAVGMPQVPA